AGCPGCHTPADDDIGRTDWFHLHLVRDGWRGTDPAAAVCCSPSCGTPSCAYSGEGRSTASEAGADYHEAQGRECVIRNRERVYPKTWRSHQQLQPNLVREFVADKRA